MIIFEAFSNYGHILYEKLPLLLVFCSFCLVPCSNLQYCLFCFLYFKYSKQCKNLLGIYFCHFIFSYADEIFSKLFVKMMQSTPSTLGKLHT